MRTVENVDTYVMWTLELGPKSIPWHVENQKQGTYKYTGFTIQLETYTVCTF